MSSILSPAASSSLTHDSTALREASSNLPRPHHFITRGDGSITPLIAVDELPESIRIVGVPAVISQAATLNMANLGVQARSQTKYIVEMPEDSGSGNTGNLSQRSTTSESNFILHEKRFGPLKTIKVEENTAAGVHDVEEWCLGVNSVDETQVQQCPVKISGDFTSTHLLMPPRLLLMPLSPPTPNPERSILLVLPRHSRRAYSARRSIVRTGSAGANVTTCSKVANTGMRCRTWRPWFRSAFAQYRNGTRIPTRRRMAGWSDLRRAREYGESHLPGLSSRYLPIIFPALSCSDHHTFHLTNHSGRLINHLPKYCGRMDSRPDQCQAHARHFQTASPRVTDHFLQALTVSSGPSITSTRLLRLNSSAPRTRSGALALVSRPRVRLFIVTHQPARKG